MSTTPAKRRSFMDSLKGLDSLNDLTQLAETPAAAIATATNPTTINRAAELPIALIDPDPTQPRKSFDEDTIKELASSIEHTGLLQAIGVRPNPDKGGRFLIVYGERRWRAHQLLGRESIRAELVELPDTTRAILSAQLIENLQNESLSPKDIADSIVRLVSGGLKHGQIADLVGKSNTWVTQYASVAKMSEPFHAALASGATPDIGALYDAYRLAKEYPEEVTKHVVQASVDKPLTRDLVRKLQAKLKGADAKHEPGKVRHTVPASAHGNDFDAQEQTPVTEAAPAIAGAGVMVTVFGDQDGPYRLMLERRAPDNKVFIERANGFETLENLADLQLTAIEWRGQLS
jgi:ParB family chromosome partitioning protein